MLMLPLLMSLLLLLLMLLMIRLLWQLLMLLLLLKMDPVGVKKRAVIALERFKLPVQPQKLLLLLLLLLKLLLLLLLLMHHISNGSCHPTVFNYVRISSKA
jgi:hypothetical protein